VSATPGPTALVTGGGSGIGAGVAERWVSQGGRVAIVDVNPAAVEETVARLGSERALGRVADVRNADAVEDAVRSVGEAFDGRLDAAVNCAGVAQSIVAAEAADEDWVRLVDIHLSGTMRVCRSAFPFLKSSDQAAIVNVSSMAASNGVPNRSNYCAAKAGIEGLTRSLAVEWAPHIRVNAVAPGFVQTKMIDSLIAEGKLDATPVIRRTPLGRFASPDEIAAVICFLLSPGGAYVTGETVRVDGGLSIDGNWYA
jgi:NAD(P)-dependent dehydrogenase (short-subunit alcohol dehydrogenase family)